MERKRTLKSSVSSTFKNIRNTFRRRVPPANAAPVNGGGQMIEVEPEAAGGQMNEVAPEPAAVDPLEAEKLAYPAYGWETGAMMQFAPEGSEEELEQRFGHKLNPEELADFKKIQQLMLNNERMVENLRPLEKSLNDSRDDGKIPKGALAHLLSQKEQDHGFSNAKLLPLGVLPREEFLELTQLGYMPKDVGAGVKHGEFTHRLQWNAIMKQFERDMAEYDQTDEEERGETPWHHTPLELYTRLGDPNLIRPHDEFRDDKRKQALWSYLMDKAGPSRERGMVHPDQVVANLRNDANPREQAAPIDDRSIHEHLPSISEVVTKRFNTRHAAAAADNGLLTKASTEAALEQYTQRKSQSENYEDLKPGVFIGRENERMTFGEINRRKKQSRVSFGLPPKPEQEFPDEVDL
jgi:hypothetical protein